MKTCVNKRKCGGYLRQGQTQGESPDQQQMSFDPHHCSVCTAYWVDWLVCLQVRLGLDPKTAHSVDHCLCERRIRGETKRQKKEEITKLVLALLFFHTSAVFTNEYANESCSSFIMTRPRLLRHAGAGYCQQVAALHQLLCCLINWFFTHVEKGCCDLFSV